MRGIAQTFSATERRIRDLEDDWRRSRIGIAIARFRFQAAAEDCRFRFRSGADNNSNERWTDCIAATGRRVREEIPPPEKTDLRKANRPHKAAGRGRREALRTVQ
jgi:hypothetical protein